MLEHLAAFLGVDTPPVRPLRERVADAAPLAHVVVHWTGNEPRSLDSSLLVDAVLRHPDGTAAEVRTRADLVTDPGGVAARLIVRGPVTDSGFDLRSPWIDAVTSWLAAAGESRATLGVERIE